jgi:hypothetical protein
MTLSRKNVVWYIDNNRLLFLKNSGSLLYILFNQHDFIPVNILTVVTYVNLVAVRYKTLYVASSTVTLHYAVYVAYVTVHLT